MQWTARKGMQLLWRRSSWPRADRLVSGFARALEEIAFRQSYCCQNAVRDRIDSECFVFSDKRPDTSSVFKDCIVVMSVNNRVRPGIFFRKAVHTPDVAIQFRRV